MPPRAYAFPALGCKPLRRGGAETALRPSRVSTPCASTALLLEDASRVSVLLMPVGTASSFQTSSQSSGSLGNGWFGPTAHCRMGLRGTERWEAGPDHAMGQSSSPLRLPLCLKAGEQL